MQHTPNANRLHIALFGRRNAGKSSLINALTGQDIALVSPHAGTTTDPVYKAMELLPIGPVVMIDTAGIDDIGDLGSLRVARTRNVVNKTDIAFLVFPADQPEPMDLSAEQEWHRLLKEAGIPVIGVLNKADLAASAADQQLERLQDAFDIPFTATSIGDKASIAALKQLLVENVPYYEKQTIVGDLVRPGDTVLLVAPQDIQAPKGRLILPQVQVMRDVLDHKGLLLTVTADQLEDMLAAMKKLPDLVITDSQVFDRVDAILPADVPLTSFSILMARYKGDLPVFVDGSNAISRLKDGDRVLIAEACTHHALQGDIAREKLPGWLRSFTGKDLEIAVRAGVDFDEDLSQYSLVIHCGACMFNRRQMMSRILRAKGQQVPMTNFGTAIAYMNGILPKVTKHL